jgi:hypothetical protein
MPHIRQKRDAKAYSDRGFTRFQDKIVFLALYKRKIRKIRMIVSHFKKNSAT